MDADIAGKTGFHRRAGRGTLHSWSRLRSYVICCVQRTGSWLLAHTLAGTGYAGRPSDYFDEEERKTHTWEWGLPSGALAPYIAAVREHATTPNGVLGSKLMWNDFDALRAAHRPAAGTDPGLEFMRAAFGDPRFVCPLPSAGRQPDRALRRSRPLGPGSRSLQ